MPEATMYPIAMPGATMGQKKNYPPEFLPSNISPYCRNMEFLNGRLQARYGLSKFSSTALVGAVLTKAELQLFSNTRYEVFATTKDIVKYDFTNARFDYLNPLYTTGTIEVQAGTPTILRGTGTLWAANVKIGDYVKLGSGSVHTGSTWYRVTVVTDNTHLTVASSMPTTAALSNYVIRSTYTGGNTDIWDWVQFFDKNLGELLIMTNGVDKPQYWSGSGQFASFGTLPATLTAAKYVSVYSERLLIAWTVEGGQNQPQRLQATQVADITNWDADAFPIDFVDEPTDIRGMTKFGTYHVIFKDTNAYVGRYVGGDFVFAYEPSYQCKGVRSAFSIITKNDFMYYYGSDKKFKKWNLLQEQNISEENFPETVQFDPNYDAFIQGFDVIRKNQVRWFCPFGSATESNYTYVFDYLFNVGIPWEYEAADACACMGTVLRESDTYCDDPTFGAQYCDNVTTFCDDQSLLDTGALVVYGGFDGYIRLADNGETDDGTAFTRTLRLKRLNFDKPDFIKRLRSQQWWFESAISGSVIAKMMVNDSSSYTGGNKTISLIPDSSDQDMVKINTVWNLMAQNFQPEISATNFFATLGCMNFLYLKRSTKIK